MKYVRKTIYMCVMMLLFSCCQNKKNRDYISIIRIAEKRANDYITSQGYAYSGTGSTCYNDLHDIDRSYISQKDKFTTVTATRIFVVEKFIGYLKIFNSCKEVRPYLNNYPFTEKNLYMRFSFHDANNQKLKPPYICTVTLFRGKVSFEEWNNDPYCPTKVVHTENFEESLAIYNQYLRNHVEEGEK